ncbi:hypothetical protein SKAU_G00145490 [Synaphobranchus kaupii]|uniref:Uncharacterized protein n=1 Tax=Synaphobranchus kaupii TaxID=118154 RepID=A0A9Q1J4P4_SYNKA|nr:hypothetical protein SKAU_G00145490 [Synaphobranchus kaupii]
MQERDAGSPVACLRSCEQSQGLPAVAAPRVKIRRLSRTFRSFLPTRITTWQRPKMIALETRKAISDLAHNFRLGVNSVPRCSEIRQGRQKLRNGLRVLRTASVPSEESLAHGLHCSVSPAHVAPGCNLLTC